MGIRYNFLRTYPFLGNKVKIIIIIIIIIPLTMFIVLSS